MQVKRGELLPGASIFGRNGKRRAPRLWPDGSARSSLGTRGAAMEGPGGKEVGGRSPRQPPHPPGN